MYVTNSKVNLSGFSFHRYEKSSTENLIAWSGNQRLEYHREANGLFQAVSSDTDRASISNAARDLAYQSGVKIDLPSMKELKEMAANIQEATAALKQQQSDDDLDFTKLDPKTQFKLLLIEALTGRKVRYFDVDEYNKSRAEAQKRADATAQKLGGGTPPAGTEQPQRVGWGVSYNYHEETREIEHASFKTGGVVKTADGKTINFSAELEMNRERITVKDVSFKAGDALKDPLVINFSGTAAQLTDEKVKFDLNSDGTAEKVSFVKAGSGFLALDKNGDGVVNNGTELFGPRTGEGFKELAAYDQDNNGWIDEGDEVYQALRIWTKDPVAGDQLSTLKDKNVGAIYLQSAGTQFALKNSENSTEGQVRTTGVYLTENGQAGTVQQVDLKT